MPNEPYTGRRNEEPVRPARVQRLFRVGIDFQHSHHKFLETVSRLTSGSGAGRQGGFRVIFICATRSCLVYYISQHTVRRGEASYLRSYLRVIFVSRRRMGGDNCVSLFPPSPYVSCHPGPRSSPPAQPSQIYRKLPGNYTCRDTHSLIACALPPAARLMPRRAPRLEAARYCVIVMSPASLTSSSAARMAASSSMVAPGW